MCAHYVEADVHVLCKAGLPGLASWWSLIHRTLMARLAGNQSSKLERFQLQCGWKFTLQGVGHPRLVVDSQSIHAEAHFVWHSVRN